jgi:hypothetical protein
MKKTHYSSLVYYSSFRRSRSRQEMPPRLLSRLLLLEDFPALPQKAPLTGIHNPTLYSPPMIKTLLLATVLAVTSIASSHAHCGSCDHKDDKKKGDKKDGEKKELVTKVQP